MLLHSKIIGQGEPFLILHGFLGMGDNWKTIGSRFSKNGYEVHLIDQRNHGRSFHDKQFSYKVLVEDLKYYCNYYNLQNIILLGHSMGGKTAMLFATIWSEMLTKLIIIDIAPRFYPIHHDEILNGLLSLNFQNLKTRKEADNQLSKYVQDFETRLFLLKNLYWQQKGILGLRINLDVLKEHVSEVGEKLSRSHYFLGDTLFLQGDASEYITASDKSSIKSHFPNSTIKTVSNAGHWLHVENPNDFYNYVMSFIIHE